MLKKRIEILSFGKSQADIDEIIRRENLLSLRGPNRYTINEAQRLGQLGQRYFNLPQQISDFNITYQLPVQLPQLPIEFSKYNSVYQYAIKKANTPYNSLIVINMRDNLYTTTPQEGIVDANVKSVINNQIYMIVVRDNSFESNSILETVKSLANFTNKIDINAVQQVNNVQQNVPLVVPLNNVSQYLDDIMKILSTLDESRKKFVDITKWPGADNYKKDEELKKLYGKYIGTNLVDAITAKMAKYKEIILRNLDPKTEEERNVVKFINEEKGMDFEKLKSVTSIAYLQELDKDGFIKNLANYVDETQKKISQINKLEYMKEISTPDEFVELGH